jgi:hypothetical protein
VKSPQEITKAIKQVSLLRVLCFVDVAFIIAFNVQQILNQELTACIDQQIFVLFKK